MIKFKQLANPLFSFHYGTGELQQQRWNGKQLFKDTCK